MRILKLIVAAGLLASTAACAVYTTDRPYPRQYAYYGYYDTHPTYYAYRYN
jgi:hypothetical protein